MTREDLIAVCERGRVPQDKWHDRDSAAAQRQLGEAWALLSAGCDFKVLDKGTLKSDAKTTWVEITFKGFAYMEDPEPEMLRSENFYLPTVAQLDHAAGGDWY